MLSQGAFKAARLDFSLPPIAAAEPITGIALGIALLGDTVSVSVAGLAAETASLAAMIVGVVLIGRSRSLADVCADPVASATSEAAECPTPAESVPQLVEPGLPPSRR
jgi:hypothetical protein